MYLSRIWLNPLRSQSRRLLANPQAMHAAVLGGMPQQPVTDRVLWRVDADEPTRPTLLVLSRQQPSWEHVVEQMSWPNADPMENELVMVRPYEPLLSSLREGQEYAFRLTANPTRATKTMEYPSKAQQAKSSVAAGRSFRLGHRTVEQQIDWLMSRSSGWGFEIPSGSVSDSVGERVPNLRVTARSRASFSRRRGDPPVSLQVVTYEGLLKVIDVAALTRSMTDGLGRAKAYGCGLLTLARLRGG